MIYMLKNFRSSSSYSSSSSSKSSNSNRRRSRNGRIKVGEVNSNGKQGGLIGLTEKENEKD